MVGIASSQGQFTLITPIRLQGMLHTEQLGICGGSVQMPHQALLKAFPRIAELLPQAVFLLISKRREGFRSFYVVCKHLGFRHSYDSGGYGQAHGITKKRVHIGLPCPLADEKLLPSYFHGDDAEVLLVGRGESEFFEASVAR